MTSLVTLPTTSGIRKPPDASTSETKSKLLQDPSSLSPRIRQAVSVLLDAHHYAHDLSRDTWDFAVELEELRNLGINSNDLRWLVRTGILDFATEVTLPGDANRSFRSSDHLNIVPSTCFALSERGVDLAAVVASAEAAASPPAQPTQRNGNGSSLAFKTKLNAEFTASLTPKWDADRHELRLDGVLVKRYKAPAANQEAILAAFDEEGWPPRIDDPISPHPDLEPKRRLHDTINSLNRNQKANLIRFFGDGTGEGVRWELTASEEPQSRTRIKTEPSRAAFAETLSAKGL